MKKLQILGIIMTIIGFIMVFGAIVTDDFYVMNNIHQPLASLVVKTSVYIALICAGVILMKRGEKNSTGKKFRK